jgi:hypothetical protein
MGKRKLSKVAKNVVKEALDDTRVPVNTTTTSDGPGPSRCSWVQNSNKLYQDYHDQYDKSIQIF